VATRRFNGLDWPSLQSRVVFYFLSLGAHWWDRPADRLRCALSLVERREIFRGLVTNLSFRFIAQILNRSPSTISREVHRNGGRQAYRATHSDQRAWGCATRPKLCKLSFNDPLTQLIARKLRRKWSPPKIAGWLKRKYPDEAQNRVSHALPGRRLRSNLPRGGQGDLIAGSNNSYIATLVERHSRFVMLAKVANKDTLSVTTALIKQARKLPKRSTTL
jgi:IS30 family transposase